jgi:hypothetical protein
MTSAAADGPRADVRRALLHLGWIVAAAALGWSVMTVFCRTLELRRDFFLVPHIGLSAALLTAYSRWSGASWRDLARERMGQGLVGAAAAGTFAVWAVLIQRPSPPPEGLDLAWSLLWLGGAYGAIDAGLISVLPVLATKRALACFGLASSRPWCRALGGLAAVVASALVNLAYHGECRDLHGMAVLGPLFGNTVLTLAYVLTGNPLAPVLSHIAMHVAAVLHGIDTTSQLPPHS